MQRKMLIKYNKKRVGGKGGGGGGVPLPQGFPGHIEGPGCLKTS